MDPDTVATVAQAAGGAATAVKAIVESLTLTRAKVKGNKDAEEKLSDSLQLVLDLQSRLLDLQEKAFQLQRERAQLEEQNTKLREEIRRKEEGAAERQKYQRKKIGRSVVLVNDEDPDAYFCPTCFETKGAPIPIQPTPAGFGNFGSHRCSTCRSLFHLR